MTVTGCQITVIFIYHHTDGRSFYLSSHLVTVSEIRFNVTICQFASQNSDGN